MQMPFDPDLLLFSIKKLIAPFLLPPLLPLLLILAGLVWINRRRRGGLALAWAGVALTLFLSTPLSVGWLLRPLENIPALDIGQAREAQAIVILGGGTRTSAPEYGGETVSRFTLERLRYGAWLARATELPVLVSGGAPSGVRPEAALMRDVLQDEFRLPVRWAEEGSLDTRGNARLSAAMLKPQGIERIVLVTHASHMPRARQEFEAAGMTVLAAPTAWLGEPPGSNSDQPPGLIPNAAAALAGWYASHEWLGRLAYKLSR